MLWVSLASVRSFMHRTNLANIWGWIPERDSQCSATGCLDEELFIHTYFDHPTGWWVGWDRSSSSPNSGKPQEMLEFLDATIWVVSPPALT